MTTGVQAVERGNIVVIRQSGDGPEIVERIVGRPGETLEAHDDKVIVNGKALDEPYLARGITTSAFGPVTLQPDSYWVMGDNRANSRDSRAYGPIGRDTIQGRVTSIVSPSSRARSF
jgi:signal peptidase I